MATMGETMGRGGAMRATPPATQPRSTPGNRGVGARRPGSRLASASHRNGAGGRRSARSLFFLGGRRGTNAS